jgi:protein phosphatase
MAPDEPAPIAVPDPALILLVGPAGAGKTTLAARCFEADEVLSSDELRARLSGDEADQSVSGLAFRILHEQAARRLEAGRLTVIDATNVDRRARRALLDIARAAAVPAVAIVLDVGLATCLDQNRRRPGRMVEPEVIERQEDALRQSLGSDLDGEGFARVPRLRSPRAVAAVAITREISRRR